MKQIPTTLMIVFMVFFTSHSSGQNIVKLSVSDAVNMALNNSIDLKNLKLDEEIQAYKNKEYVGAAYPQINASGNVTHYTNLPQFVFPTSDIQVYQVLAKEGVKDKNGNPIDISQATFGFQPISLVAPWNYQAGLDVQQVLFQPDLFIAIQARKAVLDFARKNTEAGEVNVKENVTKSYYGVLIARKQKEVAQNTLTRLTQLHTEMDKMYQAGFIEKLDLDKLSVTINNTSSVIHQLNNTIHITEAVLKNTLMIPQQDSLILTDALTMENIESEIMVAESGFRYENRKEYAVLESAIQLQKLDQRRNKIAYAPTLAAFYQLQRSGLRDNKYDVDGSGPWFSYTSGLIGLSISQPIFDGLQRRSRIQQARLSIEKLENNMIQLKQGIDLEQTVNKNTLRNALDNLKMQERNMHLAENVFEVTTKKYQSGVGSSIEMLQADTEYQRASGNYFQALYDAAIAKVSYLKSLGKL